jgi:plasmid maintenance system antidote protein VapI
MDKIELRVAMKRKGLNYTKLAEILGISYGTLWNKINQKTEFTSDEIQKLSEILDLSTEQRDQIFFKEV